MDHRNSESVTGLPVPYASQLPVVAASVNSDSILIHCQLKFAWCQSVGNIHLLVATELGLLNVLTCNALE